MRWKFDEDDTPPVITARAHSLSGHGLRREATLPERCVVFHLGRGMRFLTENYDTRALLEDLPRFLGKSPCLQVAGQEGVCFVHGGYGAPQAADTVETLCVLGVKEIVVVGMAGVFGEGASVGDAIVPRKALSEEGTSRHYFAEADWFNADPALWQQAAKAFPGAHTDPIVTTDAVYRQTFFKEALWREKGAIGVEMETSAVFSVSSFLGVRAVSLLIASDKHLASPAQSSWCWGDADFDRQRDEFLHECVEWSL